MNISDIFGIFGGISVVITGLFAYLGRTRLEALRGDLAATNFKLSAALSHSVHVTRAQFDLELEIYSEIWKVLFPVRVHTYALRPTLDQFDPSESEDERSRRRLKGFGEAFNAASGLTEERRPFIPQEVYGEFRGILDLCREEAIEYEERDPNEMKEYWRSARENRNKIEKGFDLACAAIQRRLSRAAVVEVGL